MKTIFLAGTAGSGKSTLVARMNEYYTSIGAFVANLNLDPAVEGLPYPCDIDVRDHVDIYTLMKNYDLGPNGAMIMASDLVASKVDEIQQEVDTINPDYLLIDTPGQIELFAYRESGPYFIQNLYSEQKTMIFLYDGTLLTNPSNFVSIGLLATSARLRFNLPTVSVLTKIDLIPDKLKTLLLWSSNIQSIEDAIASHTDGETYTLLSNILRSLNIGGFAQGLIPVSNITSYGMQNLEAAISRILNRGEDIED